MTFSHDLIVLFHECHSLQPVVCIIFHHDYRQCGESPCNAKNDGVLGCWHAFHVQLWTNDYKVILAAAEVSLLSGTAILRAASIPYAHPSHAHLLRMHVLLLNSTLWTSCRPEPNDTANQHFTRPAEMLKMEYTHATENHTLISNKFIYLHFVAEVNRNIRIYSKPMKTTTQLAAYTTQNHTF